MSAPSESPEGVEIPDAQANRPHNPGDAKGVAKWLAGVKTKHGGIYFNPKGGKPGVYPSFENFPQGFYPLPKKISLYDPFGIAAKDSDEKKAKGLLAEINNGRLAMIGIMGFMAEAKVPGSVPALTGLIKPFAGDVMAPLA